jgi:GNAT superfamily N-acetyltransferase
VTLARPDPAGLHATPGDLATTALRPIEAADLPACREIFYAAGDDLYDARNLPRLPRNDRRMSEFFGHLLATDPERCWLAESEDPAGGRTVVGFGMAVRRGRVSFLSFLFVAPGTQARGVGRALLVRCLPLEAPRGPDEAIATCVDSIQPISTGLYASYGIVPRLPILSLTGSLGPTDLPRLAHPITGTPFAELADRTGGDAWLVERLEELDLEALGYARPTEHGAWRSGQRQGILFRSGDDVIGYGYAQASGRLGPLYVRDPALLAPALGRLAEAVSPVEAWSVIVPGCADQALVPLLAAGFLIDGQPGLYCSTSASGPVFERYLPASYALL